VTRLGVAGLGWLGESLIKDVPRVDGLEVVAVQDVASGRAQEVATAYGVPWSGETYGRLLGREEVEAVLICTPNGLHAAQAQAALRAGKDVLVQKPLALSCADARATVDTAAETGRLLCVDYTYRFLETMRTLQAAMGPRDSIRSVRAWFFDPSKSGGGALMDLGVHLLDLGLWLVEPSRVELEQAAVADERPVEQSAQLKLRLDEIPFGVEVSWNAALPVTEISFDVEMVNGRVRWENVDGSFFHFRTLRDGGVLLDRETTLREDTLRAFAVAVAERNAPPIDVRVYDMLDRAYAVVRSGQERLP
jgi:predicted dehydrogenase